MASLLVSSCKPQVNFKKYRSHTHMGGCQNDGPLLGPLNTRCHTILRTHKGTRILTTTHIQLEALQTEMRPEVRQVEVANEYSLDTTAHLKAVDRDSSAVGIE